MSIAVHANGPDPARTLGRKTRRHATVVIGVFVGSRRLLCSPIFVYVQNTPTTLSVTCKDRYTLYCYPTVLSFSGRVVRTCSFFCSLLGISRAAAFSKSWVHAIGPPCKLSIGAPAIPIFCPRFAPANVFLPWPCSGRGEESDGRRCGPGLVRPTDGQHQLRRHQGCGRRSRVRILLVSKQRRGVIWSVEVGR